MFYHLQFNTDTLSWYIVRKNHVLTIKESRRLFIIISRKLNLKSDSVFLKYMPERAIFGLIVALLDIKPSVSARISSIDFNNDLKVIVTYE